MLLLGDAGAVERRHLGQDAGRGLHDRDRQSRAGPFTEPDGAIMNGSLVVIEAASLDAARKIAAGDPFNKAGLFASVEIRPWLWTINNPDEEE